MVCLVSGALIPRYKRLYSSYLITGGSLGRDWKVNGQEKLSCNPGWGEEHRESTIDFFFFFLIAPCLLID